MPYCKEIYRFRSSAMMAEAACFGRRVIASAECGFSDQLVSLQIGRCCSTDDEFAEAICEELLEHSSKQEQLAILARSNYIDFCLSAYQTFFNPANRA